MKFLLLKGKSLLLTQVFTPKSVRSHFKFQVKNVYVVDALQWRLCWLPRNNGVTHLGISCQCRSPEYVFVLSLHRRNPSGHPPCLLPHSRQPFSLASCVAEEPFKGKQTTKLIVFRCSIVAQRDTQKLHRD